MRAGPVSRNLAMSVGASVALFCAGWLAPVVSDTRVDATAAPHPPVFVHPGAILAEAARRLDTAGLAVEREDITDAADASVDVTPVVASRRRRSTSPKGFRRELSAVISENGAHSVLLRTPDQVRVACLWAAPTRTDGGWRQSLRKKSCCESATRPDRCR